VHEPVGPGVANLLEIYAACTRCSTPRRARCLPKASATACFKSALADAIVGALAPIQARYSELRADDDGLRRVLAESAARVHLVADATLERVQAAVGLR